MTDTNEIEIIIDEILNENNDKVSEYKSGKTKLLRFFCWSSNESLVRVKLIQKY